MSAMVKFGPDDRTPKEHSTIHSTVMNHELLTRNRNLIFVTALPESLTDRHSLDTGLAHDYMLGLYGSILRGLCQRARVHIYHTLPLGGVLTPQLTAELIHTHLRVDETPGRPLYLPDVTCVTPDSFHSTRLFNIFLDQHNQQNPESVVIMVLSTAQLANLLGFGDAYTIHPGTIAGLGVWVDRPVIRT